MMSLSPLSPAPASTEARCLRVALVFGGTIQAERLLDVPRSVVLGDGPGALWPLPAAIAEDELLLIDPVAGGYELRLQPSTGGAVWIDGTRRSIAELRAEYGDRVSIGPSDYGIVTLGGLAFFFQQVRPAPRLGGRLALDASLLSSLGLSVFLHVAALLLIFMAQRETPVVAAPLELPLDLIRSFLVTPPPDVASDAWSGGSMASGEERMRDEPAGAESRPEPMRMRRPEPSPRALSGAAERVASLGVLGALSGAPGQGSALEAALDGPDIGSLLAGLGGSLRGGPGRGRGLRGRPGDGAGGDGAGGLGGSGPLDTQVGDPRVADVPRRRPRPEVNIDGGDVTVDNNYIPPSAIYRVVRRNRAAIRYCYENELQRQPRLHGRISVRWRIGRDGRVLSARIAQSSMHNARVEGCITRQIRRWRFPEPEGGEVDVTFPFLFAAR